jgi:hypothetical protein
MSEVLLTGLKIGESARWHDGRLWLSNWGTQQVGVPRFDGQGWWLGQATCSMTSSSVVVSNSSGVM